MGEDWEETGIDQFEVRKTAGVVLSSKRACTTHTVSLNYCLSQHRSLLAKRACIHQDIQQQQPSDKTDVL